jgi:hypothetical protein
MRLTKFFPGGKSVEAAINQWVKKSPQQRSILQIIPYKEGVLVLYDKILSSGGEWESVKKNIMEKPAKNPLRRGSRRGV